MSWTQSVISGAIAAVLFASGQPSASSSRRQDRQGTREPKKVAATGVSLWHEAPALLPLLTAEHDHPGAYRVYVSPHSIDAVLHDLSADPTLERPPGAWTPRASLPLEGLGLDGRLDRGRLARLYGARRPLVARGPRVTEDGSRESWTLVSPYPDAEVRSLESGTLIVVLRLP